MVKCPICDKEFMDRRGLHGHFRFVHGKEYGSGKEAKKTDLTEAIEEGIRKRREEFLAIKMSGEKEREWLKEKEKRKKKRD